MSLSWLTENIAGCIGASYVSGDVLVEFQNGTSRLATQAEILDATKAQRIAAINAECRARLLTRFGDAAEQVSRSIGIYGATEKAALETGIADTIDASNTASDAVLAAATIAEVEAVTVAWPMI